MTATQKRRRFRPRFTVSVLLLFMTMISAPLGYVGRRRIWNQRRAEAYKKLSEEGAYLVPNQTNVRSDPVLTWWQRLGRDDLACRLEYIWTAERPRFDERQYASLTDDDLRQLANFPEIRIVSLQDEDHITDAGLAVLAQLPELRRLTIRGSPKVTGAFLRKLPSSSKLDSLTLDDMAALAGENLQCITNFNGLESVELSRCPLLTDESLRKVQLRARLKRLRLHRLNLGDQTVSRWLEGQMLEELKLSAKISRASAARLAQQTKLKILRMSNAPLTDEDFAFLADCRELTVLQLQAMPIQGAFLARLNASAPLEEVSFSNTLFQDSSLALLPRSKTTRLDWTPISGEGLARLPSFPHTISFAGCQFSEQGKIELARMTDLYALTLHANWTADDLRLLPVRPRSLDPVLSLLAAYDAWKATGKSHSFYSLSWTIRNAAEPIDNCPVELMAPVTRLRELAMASEIEEKRAAQEIRDQTSRHPYSGNSRSFYTHGSSLP